MSYKHNARVETCATGFYSRGEVSNGRKALSHWRKSLSKEERKKRFEYDSNLAKTVLAIVGVALVALLIWLDYKGY